MNKPTRAKSTKPAARRAEAPVSSDNNFYEVMPLTLGSHYVYRDDVSYDDTSMEHNDSSEAMSSGDTAATKRLAIMTLIGVAVVALALGILFASGLAALRSSMEPAQGAVTSLEP